MIKGNKFQEIMNSGNTMNKQLDSYSWNDHRQTFFNTVSNLRKQEMFCDITLACDGALFPVHRLVLAMCSEFFNEILTKVPGQQPLMVLVPTVSAAELEALLTYIYVGEIQVSRTNLPSFMKAANTLKIKGLCSSNDSIVMEQFVSHAEHGMESAEKSSIPDTEDRENDSQDSIISMPCYCSPEEMAQEPQHLSQLQDSVSSISQAGVFVNNEEDTHDMIYEVEEAEEKEYEEGHGVRLKVEEEGEEEVDPLSIPLMSPQPLIFTPATSPQSVTEHTLLPLETTNTEDSHQDKHFSKTTKDAASATAFNFRYTWEQKLQIVQYYHFYGPVKAARLMSEQIGRKVNESSVRSVVRSWERKSRLFNETQ